MRFDDVFDIERLVSLSDGLAGADPPASPAAAMERAETLYRVIDRLEAAAVTCVQAVDACGEARAEGFASTVGWLRRGCGMRASRASERVTVARQLKRLPEVGMRLVRAQLGYCATAVIARVVKNLTDSDCAKAEPILVDAAVNVGVDGAATVGRRIHQVLHPDGDLPDKDKQFERRWLRVSGLLDGMASIEGLLDPELKCRLKAALDPLAKPAGPDDRRTAGQRYADALDTFIQSKQQAHMTVIVNLATLTGGTESGRLPDGSPLPAADARRIAVSCGAGEAGGAGLTPVLTTGDGFPLDVGRDHRLATPAQRKALLVRDRGCVVEGCSIPAGWCEVDHVTPWTLGGGTDLHNLALCCAFHNKYKNRHPDRVEVIRHDDGRITYRIQRRHAPAYRRVAHHRRGWTSGTPSAGTADHATSGDSWSQAA